jgi:hypothetical protein
MAKKTRAAELREIIGEYVSIQLNDVKMFEKIPEFQTMALSPVVEGYITDVTDNFIYIGTKTYDSFDTILTPEMVAVITITEPQEDIPEELTILPGPGDTSH